MGDLVAPDVEMPPAGARTCLARAQRVDRRGFDARVRAQLAVECGDDREFVEYRYDHRYGCRVRVYLGRHPQCLRHAW